MFLAACETPRKARTLPLYNGVMAHWAVLLVLGLLVVWALTLRRAA